MELDYQCIKVFLLFAEPVEPLIATTESLIPGLEAAEPAPPSSGRCTVSPNLMFHSYINLSVFNLLNKYKSLRIHCR